MRQKKYRECYNCKQLFPYREAFTTKIEVPEHSKYVYVCRKCREKIDSNKPRDTIRSEYSSYTEFPIISDVKKN